MNAMAFHLRHIAYNIDRSWRWILIRSHITRVCALLFIFDLFHTYLTLFWYIKCRFWRLEIWTYSQKLKQTLYKHHTVPFMLKFLVVFHLWIVFNLWCHLRPGSLTTIKVYRIIGMICDRSVHAIEIVCTELSQYKIKINSSFNEQLSVLK